MFTHTKHAKNNEFYLQVQLVTLYKQTGRVDHAIQYCYELVVEGELFRESRKWHSCVVEMCEIYQVWVVLNL